jgi:Sucrase/ferredoxin-like
MSESSGPVSPALSGPPACCEWSRSQGLDPVGSAGQYAGFLLVEQPLPWPFDVSSLPELVDVAELAAAAGLRLQTVIPVGQPGEGQPGEGQPDGDIAPGVHDSGDDRGEGPPPVPEPPPQPPPGPGPVRRVICYRSARPGWAGPLVRSESAAAPGSLAEATARLLSQTPGPGETGPGETGPGDAQPVDLLVCTHGRRDACCGGRGIGLVNEILRDPLFGPPSGVRLWRTSHTGGHRFAPTSIVLPAGTMWAYADVALLGSVTRGAGDLDQWLGRYRGCATLGSPSQQAVERAVLAEVGWPLMGSWRRASYGDGVVRLESDVSGTWEASVREGRRVPQPDCRTSPDLATKQSVEWVVEGLRQVVAVQ